MSTVIKCGHELSSGKLADLKPLELSLMGEDGRSAQRAPADLLEKARQEAEIIVRSARGEAQSIQQQAYDEGYQAGAADAAQTVSALVERLESDISRLAEDRQSVLEAIEPEALKLCMEAVEKIIRHEIRTDPRVVVRTIKSCLRRVKDSTEVYVRVSPKEVAEVRAMRDELLEVAEGVRAVNVQDDRRISPGGCVVESASGDFDARVEMQIDRINNKITEIYTDDRYQTDA